MRSLRWSGDISQLLMFFSRRDYTMLHASTSDLPERNTLKPDRNKKKTIIMLSLLTHYDKVCEGW